jgi:hypothetical protein
LKSLALKNKNLKKTSKKKKTSYRLQEGKKIEERNRGKQKAQGIGGLWLCVVVILIRGCGILFCE